LSYGSAPPFRLRGFDPFSTPWKPFHRSSFSLK